MKLLTIILLCLIVSATVSARPKYLGRLLTTSTIQSTFPQYKVTKGKVSTSNGGSLFSNGELTFYDGGTLCQLQTDYEGRVYSECLFFLPKTAAENNALINLYKAEGRVTSDQTSDSYRSIAIYITKTQDRIISSDIVSSWSQNSLGRVWDFSTRVTYILTTR